MRGALDHRDRAGTHWHNVEAQLAPKTAKIGFLIRAVIRQARVISARSRELGYVEGKNITLSRAPPRAITTGFPR